MKTAASVILVNLAWIGLLVASAAAQEEIPPGAASDPAPMDQPAAEEAPFDPFGSSGAVAERPNPFLPEGSTIVDEGGCDSGGPADDAAVCAMCGEGDCLPSLWYTDQEIRLLTRRIHKKFLPITFEDEPGLNQFGQPALVPVMKMSTNSVPFNVASGYSVAIGRYLGWGPHGYDAYLEGVYWGMNEWTVSQAMTGTRLTDNTTFPVPVSFGSLNTQFPTAVGGFNRADEHLFTYNSDINNVELNVRVRPRSRADRLVMYPNGCWRRECQPGYYTSCIVGVRYLQMNEDFRFHSQGSIEIDNGAPTPTSGDYFSKVHNSLIVMQFGGDFIRRECRWSYGVRGKLGPFVNYSDAEIRASTDALADPFATSAFNFARTAEKTDWGVFAEGGVIGSYKLRPNLSLHAAYDLLWIARVATAPLQVRYEVNPPSVIDVYSSHRVWYQGITLGVEWLR